MPPHSTAMCLPLHVSLVCHHAHPGADDVFTPSAHDDKPNSSEGQPDLLDPTFDLLYRAFILTPPTEDGHPASLHAPSTLDQQVLEPSHEDLKAIFNGSAHYFVHLGNIYSRRYDASVILHQRLHAHPYADVYQDLNTPSSSFWIGLDQFHVHEDQLYSIQGTQSNHLEPKIIYSTAADALESLRSAERLTRSLQPAHCPADQYVALTGLGDFSVLDDFPAPSNDPGSVLASPAIGHEGEAGVTDQDPGLQWAIDFLQNPQLSITPGTSPILDHDVPPLSPNAALFSPESLWLDALTPPAMYISSPGLFDSSSDSGTEPQSPRSPLEPCSGLPVAAILPGTSPEVVMATADLKSKEGVDAFLAWYHSQTKRKGSAQPSFKLEKCPWPGCHGPSFRRQHVLKDHLYKHIQSKTYACTNLGCDRKFSTVSNQGRHTQHSCPRRAKK